MAPGQKVLNSKGATFFFVPKTGGAFFPKAAVEGIGYNAKIWDHYANAVELNVTRYNQAVKLHNQDVEEATKPPKQSRFWLFRLFGG
jgi:hypothetical protein